MASDLIQFIQSSLSEAQATEATLAARIADLDAANTEIAELEAELAAAQERIRELEALQNKVPVGGADTLAATQDTRVTYSAAQLLANDSDADPGDVLRIASVASGTGGAVVLNADGTVTFTPAAGFSGAASFVYTVTDGKAASASVSVTVNVAPATPPTARQTILTTQVPVDLNRSDNQPWEVGVRFTTAVDGLITAIRFFKSAGETGTRTGKLWTDSAQLGSVAFANETASGWQEQAFSTPIQVRAGTVYTASVNINRFYTATNNGFASAITNGSLTAPVQAGRYGGTVNARPNAIFANQNYFVDVVFVAQEQPTTALDFSIQGEADAAQFLRTATMGPTLSEITTLAASNNAESWFDAQVAASYDGSQFAEWTPGASGKFTRKPGWIAQVNSWMTLPRGEAFSNEGIDSGEGHADRPQRQWYNYRMIDTGLLYNNPPVGGLCNPTSAAAPRAPQKSLMLRLSWIMSKFIVTSIPGGGVERTRYDGPAWYELISRHVFGNYADFLEEVTYSFPMAKMLTHYANARGPQADQNFAREIVQLMTMGIWSLNDGGVPLLDQSGQRVPNYVNQDIVELSKVYTGLVHPWLLNEQVYYQDPAPEIFRAGFSLTTDQRWIRDHFGAHFRGVSGNDRVSRSNEIDVRFTNYGYRKPLSRVEAGKRYRIASVSNGAAFASIGADSTPAVGEVFLATADGTSAMVSAGLVEEQHISFAGSYPRLKISAGLHDFGAVSIPRFNINIPAGTDPETEIRLVTKALVNHPSTAPYVCTRLIRFATTANPSPGYVSRVVRVFRDNVDNPQQMAAVWKAILFDPEVRTGTRTNAANFGRLRDPYELFTGLIRPLGFTSHHTSDRNEVACFYRGPGNQNGMAPAVAPSNKQAGFLFVTERDDDDWDAQVLLGVYPTRAPSIFGHYPPDGTMPGDTEILSPESILYTPGRLSSVSRVLERLISFGPNAYRTINRSAVDQPILVGSLAPITYDWLPTSTPAALVNRLDLLLTGGRTPANRQQEIITAITPLSGENRVGLVAQTLINSPDFYRQ